jgi:hypothetical protein
MKCVSCVFVLLLIGTAVAAQEPQVTSDTVLDSATLEKWLHGDDARLVAWAADYTRRNPDPKILAEMPGLFDHWSIPLGPMYATPVSPQIRADFAVLDALIQTNTPVPVDSIVLIAPFFPEQAALLISRRPLSEARSTLFDWTYGTTGTSGDLLARIASMMLAKDPKGREYWIRDRTMYVGFVAKVVADSETTVYVTVKSNSNHGFGTGVGGSCGDSFGRKSPAGWPEIHMYGLDETDSETTAPVIVELDGDRIVSVRETLDGGRGSCEGTYPFRVLDAVTRHRLIAYWLGVADKDMNWQPTLGIAIVWAGRADYEQRLGKIVESQREKLRATVSSLQQRGFLTKDEAAKVSPQLSVIVTCQIDPCPLGQQH